MVVFVWEFIVRANKIRDFEHHYAWNGTWAQLFRKSQGYRGTILLRDSETSGRYLTIDRWDSDELYQEMRKLSANEYGELDCTCEEYTESERCIGIFEDI